MKVSIKDLKKVVQWAEANSKDVMIDVNPSDRKIYFTCQDRYEKSVEMTVFQEASMEAKIRKEDFLRDEKS